MIPLLAAGSAFCFVWALYYALSIKNRRDEANEHIQSWFEEQGVKKESWSDSLSRKMNESQWGNRIRPKLENASLDIEPADYGAILFFAGMIILLALRLGMNAPWWISIVIAIVAVPIGSHFFLRSRRFVYVSRLNGQLSEACRLLSSAARAGLSIMQGLELVVEEMPNPIRKELGTVVQEVRLGRSLESALKDFIKRFESSRDLRVFANALIIQRRAGGDLARVMSQMANTMEERKIIHQTIQSVTAQARYSAYALPIVSILIVFMMSRLIDGFCALFTTIPGIIILSIFVIMQVIGIIVVRKISDIKV